MVRARCEPTFPHLRGCSSTGPGRIHAAGVSFFPRNRTRTWDRASSLETKSLGCRRDAPCGVFKIARGRKGVASATKGDCVMPLAEFLMVDPKVLILIGAFLVALAAGGVSNRFGR